MSGRPALLARYARAFEFAADQDGVHRHPEYSLADDDLNPTSAAIIIEVDNEA